MKLEYYPALGQKVSYIFQTDNNVVQEGEGTVVAIGLGKNDNRALVTVETLTTPAKEYINVDLQQLNPSPEYKERFSRAIEAISKAREQASCAQQEIGVEFQKTLKDLSEPLLSSPVSLVA